LKKGWLELYALLVCFFTVACFAIVLGMTIWDTVKLAAPEFAMYSEVWEEFQSDDAFKARLIRQHSRSDEDKASYAPPEGAALTEAREQGFVMEIQKVRRTALQDLILNLIILLVDVGLFAVHWKIATRARQSSS